MKSRQGMHHRQEAVYCIGKPAPFMAVFAAPPSTKKNEYYNPYPIVQNETAEKCEVGFWYSIAYRFTEHSGENVVTGETPILPWQREERKSR